MRRLEQMAHAILDEIEDIEATTERFDLCEQPDAGQSGGDSNGAGREISA